MRGTIAGKFDRPWFDRPIFGTIRYMSGNAAHKIFDVERYIAKMAELAGSQRIPSTGRLFD
jgi:deoxyribodipyrimidine photo-lyase